MNYSAKGAYLNDTSENPPRYIIFDVQLHSDNNSDTWNGEIWIADHIHAVLINCLIVNHQYLIYNKKKLACLLPVGGGLRGSATNRDRQSGPIAAKPAYSGRVFFLDNYIVATSHGPGQKEKIVALHNALWCTFEPH